jgi:hypothetical protein
MCPIYKKSSNDKMTTHLHATSYGIASSIDRRKLIVEHKGKCVEEDPECDARCILLKA